MALAYSDQITGKRDIEAGTAYSLQNGLSTTHGKVTTVVGTYTSTAIAAGSTIYMVDLPKGARVVRANLITGALGASVTLAVGTDVALTNDAGTALTAAGTANLLAATSTAAASNTAFCATRLLGALGLTSAPTRVALTTAGATLAAGIEVLVVVEYLQH